MKEKPEDIIKIIKDYVDASIDAKMGYLNRTYEMVERHKVHMRETLNQVATIKEQNKQILLKLAERWIKE